MIDVEMLPQMDNTIEYSFEIHLLLIKWFVTFSLSLKFLVYFYTWSEDDKLYFSRFDSDTPQKKEKLSQSLPLLTSPSDVSSFRVFIPSNASKRIASSNQDFDFLVDHSSYLVPSHTSFNLASVCFICSESWYFRIRTWLKS